MKKAILIIAVIAVTLIILFIVGKYRSRKFYRQEIKTLLNGAEDLSNQKFSYAQLQGLPAPVQRYFRHVLQEGQSYVSTIYITQKGTFKVGLDKDWVNIRGEQLFSAEPPAFVWQGITDKFTARDMYLKDQGRLVVRIMNAFKIMQAEGRQYNEGELLRWLGESVWFPTNLLPGENLFWKSVDDNHAYLYYKYQDMTLKYLVTFNEKGEIIRLKTTRFMDEQNKETWVGNVSNYETIGGMKVPTKIEAAWVLNGEEKAYARFEVIKMNLQPTLNEILD